MARISEEKLEQYRALDLPPFEFRDPSVSAFFERAAAEGYSLDTTGFLANPGFFQAPHRRGNLKDIDIAMVENRRQCRRTALIFYLWEKSNLI